AALAAEVIVEALLPGLQVRLLVLLPGLADRALAAERIGRERCRAIARRDGDERGQDDGEHARARRRRHGVGLRLAYSPMNCPVCDTSTPLRLRPKNCGSGKPASAPARSGICVRMRPGSTA